MMKYVSEIWHKEKWIPVYVHKNRCITEEKIIIFEHQLRRKCLLVGSVCVCVFKYNLISFGDQETELREQFY